MGDTKLEKKIDEHEGRMKEYVGSSLAQLRLEINNDRLTSLLNSKEK